MKIHKQCFWNEKACSTRLQGFVAGDILSTHVTQQTHITQCSIPAFEGLLDKRHDRRLITLLYRTAEWHGLAKIRIHTQSTLEHLESLTNEFGRLMRCFRDLTCSQFHTKELPCEAAAQWRAQRCAQARVSTTESQSVSEPSRSSGLATSAQRTKTLNLFTPKFHALGDYVQTIRMFGTTDSFSTQLVKFMSSMYTYYMLTMVNT